MPYYLSRYVGLGTEADPCRALGADEPGAAAIDLRADGGASPEGDGLNVCLLYLPTARSLPGLERLADDAGEPASPAIKARLRNVFGLAALNAETFDALVLELLLNPPAHGWKPVIPSRTAERFEVTLGPLRKTQRVLRGGATASDDFNRANQFPIGGAWTSVPVIGTLDLFNNALLSSGNTAEAVWNAASFGPDQFSQATIVAISSTGDCGPVCRSAATNPNTFYQANAFASDEQLLKRVTGTYTKIQSVTTPNIVAGDILRLEVEGSTLRFQTNGATVTNGTATDTALTGGAVGLAAAVVVTFDTWSGGDLAAGPGGGVLPPRVPMMGATAAAMNASHF